MAAKVKTPVMPSVVDKAISRVDKYIEDWIGDTEELILAYIEFYRNELEAHIDQMQSDKVICSE